MDQTTRSMRSTASEGIRAMSTSTVLMARAMRCAVAGAAFSSRACTTRAIWHTPVSERSMVAAAVVKACTWRPF